MINPIVEYYNIRQWLDKFIGTSVTPKTFISKLSKYLNRSHPLRMKLKFNNEILDTVGDFTIGGLYEPNYDEAQQKPVVLFLYINYPVDHQWAITQSIVDAMSLELTETLTHELRHLHQHRSRGYLSTNAYHSRVEDIELREAQEYLGSTDEIDAYAMNIAVRLHLGHNHGHDMEKYLRSFGDHRVTRRLRKKIYKNLNHFGLL